MTNARFKAAGLCAGISLALAASFPAVSQTDLAVQNDGTALTANAVSSQQVLSMTLRISGPNDFLVEQRVEDSLIQWVPDAVLADGVYHWETIAVTVEKGAPMRPIARPAIGGLDVTGSPAGPDLRSPNDDGAKASIRAPDGNVAAPELPVERLFSDEYKSVERETGAFLVRDGWIEPLPRSGAGTTGKDGESLGAAAQPGLLGRVAGAISEFLFPSAHALTNVDNVLQVNDTAADGATRVFLGSNTSNNWWLQNDSGTVKMVSFPGSDEVIGFQKSGTSGEIGIGTTLPAQPIHISDPFPRIRLDDSNDAATWHIKAVYSGTFQIGEASGETSAFTINPGATNHSIVLGAPDTFCDSCVGIGTDTPERSIHIVDTLPAIFLEDSDINDRWQLLAGGTFSINHFSAGSVPFRIEGSAPTGSLSIDSAGFVGIGTNAPDAAAHVRRSDNTAEVRVEDTGALDGQTMFNLLNNGHPKFRLRDTSQADVRWEFRTVRSAPNDGFTINKIGSGVLEMDLEAGGNVTFAGTVNGGSSRTIKQDIEEIDVSNVLDKIEALEVKEWSYKQAPGERRIGPMAEDFHALFGLGPDDKHIAATDMAGVALAAIKAVREENEALRDRLERLEAQLAER